MKVQGEFTLPLGQQAAWDLVLNTEVLARVIPGCQSLQPVGSDEYEMKMKLAISSIQGLFAGKVKIEDRNPPYSYRLVIDGQGKIGFLRGSGLLVLASESAATRVSYNGEVQVGGMIAGVGERMLDMATKMMLKRFFEGLLREAEEPPT
ncbi:MAG: carbon monoxide dehydrogenase subunit G [Acidobacteria bacterium]|nr:carbon monoxide dehydrogenase subunit G [Acidobacteriota bacterium]